MPRNIVAMLYALLSIVVLILAFFASRSGIAERAWEVDTTYFTSSIVVLFVVGFVAVTRAILQASDMLDAPRSFPRSTTERELTAVRLSSQIEPLEWIAYVLNMISFLAIIWGMIEGLSEIASMSISGAEGAVTIAQVLIQHFNVALFPTATGIVAYLVLQSYIVLLRYGHRRILAGG